VGRRALRKLDPNLDLAAWLKPLDTVPRPWEPEAWFDRCAPLEVEIGSGKGLFLANAAQQRPQHDFVGLEVAGKYAAHTAARLARANLTNAVVVHGDGLRVFREILPASGVLAVHVYFPDPWWKARHRKRRVLNASFLHDVQRVLAPGGELHFWTDVLEYFETSLELIQAETTLFGPLPVPETAAQHDLDYRTHFERRMRQHQQPVYRSLWRRELAPPCSAPAVESGNIGR
jgi:tRNA (guanine-N7-)-methyltransferase